MERRNFLSSLGSLVAMGSLSTPAVGFATTGGLTLTDTSEAGLDAYLDELKAQLRRIESARLQSDFRRYFRQRGFPGRMAKDIARTLLVTSAVRDLPPKIQEHPKVQRRLAREAPRIARTVMRLTDFLKGHSKEELADIQAHLKEHPDLGEEITANFTDFTHRQDLPPERREQTRHFMESTAWKMTHQPPNLMLDEYTEKVDRITAAGGFQQEHWEAHYVVVDEESAAEPGADFWADLDFRHPVVAAGLRTMGVGGSFVLGGTAILALGGVSEVFIGVGMTATCVGGGIAFVGLIILFVGMMLDWSGS